MSPTRAPVAPITHANTLRHGAIVLNSIHRESDDAFLLAACEYQGLYFISQHKKFPLAFDPTKTLNDQYLEGRYVALLRPKGKRAGRFELVTFACENCDTRLGKYSCGTFTMDPARQVLAEIEQKVVKLDGPGNLSARRVTVNIPRTHDNGTRAVWCPRCPRKSGLGISLPSTLPVAPVQTAAAPAPSGSYASLRTESFMSTMSGPAVAAMSGSMQPPPLPRPSGARSDTRSDDESSAGGFSLSDDDDVGAGGGAAAGAGAGAGAGSRPSAGSSSPVLTHTMASRRSENAMRPPPAPLHRRSKSMPGSLMSPAAAEVDLTNDTEVIVSQVPEWNKAEGSLVMEFIGDRISDPSTKNYLLSSAERSKDVLQFGRQSKHKFAFDVRHPLSVLQGFGIFLSAFVWSVDQISEPDL